MASTRTPPRRRAATQQRASRESPTADGVDGVDHALLTQVAPHLRRRRDWALPQRALRLAAAPLLPGGRGRLLVAPEDEEKPSRRDLRRERRGQDGDDEAHAPLLSCCVQAPIGAGRQAQGHDAIYGPDDRGAHGRVEPSV